MKVKLKDIGTIITGNTPSKKEKSYWDSKDICFVKPDIISETGISLIEDSNEYISEAARSKARIVSKDAIFITCIGSIGKIGIACEGDYAFNQQINAIVPNDKVDSKYLAYALLNSKSRLEAIANAPVVPIINKSQFGDFSINIEEDRSVQLDIVLTLDTLSKIIKKRIEELKILDDLIKARFVELFEDGTSPLRTVEELCSEIVDCPHTTPKYEGVLKHPAIRTSEIKKGYITWDTMKYVSDDEYKERIARLRPEQGDIVYGREGIFGNAAILPVGYQFCLGQRVMLLRPDYSKCTSEYLLFAVISDDVYRQAVGKNNASTVAHVNVKDVKRFKIPLPSFEKQNEFALFVKQVNKTKKVVQNSLNEHQLLFDSLMQCYFG